MTVQLISTGIRIFGFRVFLDKRMSKNTIELRNEDGSSVRIEFDPPAAAPPQD